MILLGESGCEIVRFVLDWAGEITVWLKPSYHWGDFFGLLLLRLSLELVSS